MPADYGLTLRTSLLLIAVEFGGADLEKVVPKISIQGLQRRAILNSKGLESGISRSLIEFVEVNETTVERKLVLFHGQWYGDIDRVFREFAC